MLKRRFTIKRIKQNNAISSGKNSNAESQQLTNYSDRLQNEFNILKLLIQTNTPKCHTMLKTSNHTYVVYDEYPQMTLDQYLKKYMLTPTQKKQFIKEMAGCFKYFNEKGIIVVGADFNNIYLNSKGCIKFIFTDFTLSMTKGTQMQISNIPTETLPQDLECMAPEIYSKGLVSQKSDIYSLGKILIGIYNSGEIEFETNVVKLDQFLLKMVSKNPNERPTLQAVWETMQEFSMNDVLNKTHQLSTFTFAEKQQNLIEPQSAGLRSMKSNPNLLHSAEKLKSPIPKINYNPKITLKKIKSINQNYQNIETNITSNTLSIKVIEEKILIKSSQEDIKTKKLLKINSYSELNEKTLKKIDGSISSTIFLQKINKNRNLCQFILELSDYVFKNKEFYKLGFLLFKLSYIKAQKNLNQSEENFLKINQDLTSANIINEIVLDQARQLQNRFIQTKELLIEIYKTEKFSSLFLSELNKNHQIYDAYLNSKMIKFAKFVLRKTEDYSTAPLSEKKCNSAQKDSLEMLFNTYMILKKIQQRSYELFWTKIYLKEYGLGSSQKYFESEKAFGCRYIRSKILEIVLKYDK